MNVVALALFRHPRSSYEDPRCGISQGRFFANCLPAIIRGYAVCYPGWRVRIYHDDSILYSQYGDALFELARRGVIDLVDCNPATTLCGSMLWRLKPASDPRVERFICRDVDAMPTPREAQAVANWISSGAGVHVIHDFSSHTGYMGGMMGFRADTLRETIGADPYAKAIEYAGQAGIDLNEHGGDQRVLNRLFKDRLATTTYCSYNPAKLPHAEFRLHAPIPEPDLNDVLDKTTGSIGTPFDQCGAVAAYRDAASADQTVADAIAGIVDVERGLRMNDQAYGNPPPNRYVVSSSDLNHDYAFYLPIAASMWMSLGYRPVFYLVGSSEEWKSHKFGRVAMEEARRRGARILFVDRVSGYRDSTVAQTVRLAGAQVPLLFDDDYILTTDIDMLPLSRTFFEKLGGAKVDVLFDNAYAEQRPHWPICYIGMTRLAWQDLLGTYPSASAAVTGWLEGNLSRSAPSMEAWCFDEYFVSAKIAERVASGLWDINRRDRMKAPAGWPASRIDRSAWDETLAANVPGGVLSPGAVDCHAPRPGYACWASRIRPLLDAFEAGLGASFDRYASEFAAGASG